MDTPKVVCNAIRAYFLQQGLTLTAVANQLGLSLGAITNLLSGGRYFGKNAATKWVKEFGFSYLYLTSGVGSLIEEQEKAQEDTEHRGVFIPEQTLELYTSLAKTCDRLSEMVEKMTYGYVAEQKKSSGIANSFVKENKGRIPASPATKINQ